MASPLARDSALSTIGVLVQGAARFLVSVLVGRLAGPAALATVSGGMSTATFASLLWPTAAGQAATKFVARESAAGREPLVPAVLRHLARRTALACALLAPAGALVGVLVLGMSVAEAAWVAALVLAFSGYNLVRGIQFGTGRIARATGWEVVSASTTLVLLALVLWLDLSALYLAPLTLGYGAYTVVGWPRQVRDQPVLPAGLRSEMDAFIGWGVAGTVASTGLLQLSMVVAAAVQPGSRAGMYAAALSLATPASMLARSFSMVLFPAMARSVGRGDPGRLAAQTDAATRALMVTMVLLFGSIALLAEPVLTILYTPDFLDATPLLRLLLLAVLLTTLPIAATNAMTSQTATGIRTSALMSSVGFVVGMVVMALAAPVLGVTGVAIAYVVGAVTLAALPFGYIWRRDRHRWGGLVLRLAVGVLLVVALVTLGPTDAWWWPYASAAGFTLAWLAMNLRDVRMLVAEVSR